MSQDPEGEPGVGGRGGASSRGGLRPSSAQPSYLIDFTLVPALMILEFNGNPEFFLQFPHLSGSQSF